MTADTVLLVEDNPSDVFIVQRTFQKLKLQGSIQVASDGDEAICSLFDVIKMKKMYGKEVRGVERSTFLIDAKGVLRREFRGVKVPGHVEAIVEAVQAI